MAKRPRGKCSYFQVLYKITEERTLLNAMPTFEVEPLMLAALMGGPLISGDLLLAVKTLIHLYIAGKNHPEK